MTRYIAFLRSVNVGGRQLKMVALRAALEASGFCNVQTLLASGNVLFDAVADVGLKPRLDQAISVQCGFPVEVVLRTVDALRDMIDSAPFAGVSPDADVKLYVALRQEPLDPSAIPAGKDGDFDVLRIDPREVFLLAHRLPNGRYGEGLDKWSRQMEKAGLVTIRNWNTIIKAAG